MPRILVLSGVETERKKLGALLSELPEAKVYAYGGVKDAEDCGDVRDYDLVVINSPLTDENGFRLGEKLARTSTCGILLLIKKDAEKVEYVDAEEAGAVIFEKPFTRELFLGIVKTCLAARRRIERLFEKAHQLEDRVEETKLVGRAKCVLIQYLNMTEAQAHRYIEKQAMDMRMSRASVARGILSAYEI